METESLDDQEVSNLATLSSSLSNTLHGGTGKGRKHSFFQVGQFKSLEVTAFPLQILF